MFNKPSPVKVAIGRLLVFVSGSLGTLLLAFAAINDAILLHVKLGNWNLLWYAGILGACFSIGKSMLPKSDSPYFGHARGNLINDMNLELEKLATHTHYFPDSWRGKAWDEKTKMAFAPMFQFKANHFAMEVLSIIAAPIILGISLPRCSDKLCRFVRDSKVEVPTVGDVVGYSTFDFDSFEDENWRNNGELEQSSKRIEVNDRPKSRYGKMEKSFFNFKGVYANWIMPVSGKNLVDKIEYYRHHQVVALDLERILHKNAAAVQMETLRRLEIDRERQASAGLARFVDDRYHQQGGGPDSGGGGEALTRRSANYSQHSNEISGLGTFGSLSSDDLHQPQMHFEESTHSYIPPSHAFAHSSVVGGDNAGDSYSLQPISASQQILNNIPGSANAGSMPTEQSGLLNQSSLIDPLFRPQQSRGLNNQSTLEDSAYFNPLDDPVSASQLSFTGSLVPLDDPSASILDVRSDQQYSILDQYHSENGMQRR